MVENLNIKLSNRVVEYRKLLTSFGSVLIILPAGLFLNYVLNVVIAQKLSIGEFGLWGYVNSFANLLALIAGLGFSSSMMRFVAAYRENNQYGLLRGLVRNSLLFVGITGTIILAGFIACGWFFPNIISNGMMWGAILVVPLAIDSWRMSTMRGLLYTLGAIVPKQILLPGLTLGLVLFINLANIEQALIIYIGIFILIEFGALLDLRRRLLPLYSDPAQLMIKSWVFTSIPMGITSIGRWGLKSLDILIIGSFISLEAAGPYVAAARTALLASLVIRIINLVIGPLLAQSYHGGNLPRFQQLLKTGTLISAILGIPLYLGLMLFSKQIMGIFGSGYEGDALLLRILGTGQLINLITGPVGLALNMSEYERENMILLIISFIIGVAAMMILSQISGVVGVAYASAGTTIFLNLALVCMVYVLIYRKNKELAE